MKNKNLALVAVLFTISVIMAFANGPAPLVTIDTDQIVDGAVTAIKTDGSLMLSDGSNATDTVKLKNASFTGDIDVTGDVGAATVNGMTPGTMVAINSPVPVANGGTGKTTAAEALAALGGASLNGSSTVAFNASTINGVAPLTAAEKTQALVGSTTVDFLAQKVTANDIKLTASPQANIVQNTSDGADSRSIAICGGGAVSGTRGAYIILHGEQHVNYPEQIRMVGASLFIGVTLPTYADNAAAISGGLLAGDVYRTSAGVLMIVY